MHSENVNPKPRTSKQLKTNFIFLKYSHKQTNKQKEEINKNEHNSLKFDSVTRYFDDDEEATPDLAYIPAPGSPSAEKSNQVFARIFLLSLMNF